MHNMARQIIAWQCEFCGEIKKSQYIAERHEVACLKNPHAVNCQICAHRTWDYEDDKAVCSLTNKQCTRAVSANCNDFKREKPYDKR